MEEYESETAQVQLEKWMTEVFKSKNYDNLTVKVTGTIEKGEGFIGDVVFAEILTQKNGTSRRYSTVLKLGKCDLTRTIIAVRSAFEREIVFYSKCVPSFTAFLREKFGNQAEISFLPQCFGTLLLENTEIIVLQNLKDNGYELHDRKHPMNINHLKLTLEIYGKYHALSFALQDQKPKLFQDQVFENVSNFCTWQKFTEAEIFRCAIESVGKNFADALLGNNETELLKLYEEKIGSSNTVKFWLDLIDMKFDEQVLIHGDCWNSNFMFKYKADDISKSSPQKACFYDFQFCKLFTPVSDLSYHLCACCPAELLSNPEEFLKLLKTYHNSLKENLAALGSDVEKCFPYEKLIEHWKKFAAFGCIVGAMVVSMSNRDTEDVESIEEINEYMGKIQIKGTEDMKRNIEKRLIAMLRNYLELAPNF